MKRTMFCVLVILAIGVGSASGLNAAPHGIFDSEYLELSDNTGPNSRKPWVEIRLEYSEDLDNKPVEITLIRKNKEYSKKTTKGQLNYFFYNLKPGKYLILLTFRENGKKSYIATYGEDTWLQEGIDIDSKGMVSSSNRVVKENEIKVYKYRRVIVDLLLTFKGKSDDSTQPDSGLEPILGQFFKKYHLYRKEKKSVYYKLHFERTFRYGNIDKNRLKEMEKIRMEFKEDNDRSLK